MIKPLAQILAPSKPPGNLPLPNHFKPLLVMSFLHLGANLEPAPWAVRTDVGSATGASPCLAGLGADRRLGGSPIPRLNLTLIMEIMIILVYCRVP
jgi:hypothetical protein